MKSSARFDSEGRPERFLAAYLEDDLILVLRRGGGPIYPPEEDAHPLARHAALSGQFVLLEMEKEILEVLAKSSAVEEVVAGLEALGLEVVETPASALEWI